MSFVHLHTHSHYSLLDALGTPAGIIKRAKEQGASAVALTDNGVIYGAVEFYKAAQKEGIKPIIGCEIYVQPEIAETEEEEDDKKKKDTYIEPYELVLLAETNEGYANLLRIITEAQLNGFDVVPRVSYEFLKENAAGLIALSGGVKGELARHFLNEDGEAAQKALNRYVDIFGKENFFIEVQDRPQSNKWSLVRPQLMDLSKSSGVPLVATNDARYVTTDKRQAHDILVCVQVGKTIHNESRLRYDGDFSMRDPDEMKQAFADCPEAVENTVKIADRCEVTMEFNQNLIPSFDCPEGMNPESYLRHLCEEGLKERYGGTIHKEAQDRLDYELGIVNKMGFDTYFLIVWDFVKYAKDQGIIVGPGRGSAAGAIITYALRITELDPLEYGLLFERFLNPERISMPDIDIDFEDERREEVLDYVVEKYGRLNVAQILTFGTMAAKAAIRDVGRALGYPYSEVDRVAKLVPPPILGKNAPLAESIEEDPEMSKVYQSEPRVKVLLDNAVLLEGTVRNVGTHACAVIISEKPLVEYTALQKPSGGGDGLVTQFSMGPLEGIGLLKMDFLGLKNLTIMRKTMDIIKNKKGVDVDIDHLPLEDPGVFELLQKGDTTGVFQLESAGMRRYLKELKPTSIRDIIAMNALYRPGPMQYIPQYIEGKHHPEKVHYMHDSFKEIIEETYGVAVYQEQVLKLAQMFAGFTLGQADILRKAVGKKIPALLAEQRVKFVEGAKDKGHDAKFAAKVFDEVIEPFSGYGFNKAHAACYGYIAFLTAYLKSHYPAEFMAALMTTDCDNTDRIVFEVNECGMMGIEVLPPDINESFANFTVVSDEQIRFGLSAIKGVGEGTVKEIIQVREETGEFKSLDDIAKKVPYKLLNKKVLQALAYAGALDAFGDRRSIAEGYQDVVDFAKDFQESNAQNQTDIFGMMVSEGDEEHKAFTLKELEPMGVMDRLQKEKETLGLFVSGHPLQGLKTYMGAKVSLIRTLSKRNCGTGETIKVGGLITTPRRITTKKGDYMMYFGIEDPTGRMEIVMFPRAYNQFGEMVKEGNIAFLEGRLEWRRDAFQLLMNSMRLVSLPTMIRNAKERGNYDPNERVSFGDPHDDEMMDEESSEEVSKVEDSKEEKKEIKKEVVEEKGPYIVKVPASIDLGVLEKIKKELLANKGEVKVEIHLGSESKIQRIKVPFGVAVTEELKGKIDSLLK